MKVGTDPTKREEIKMNTLNVNDIMVCRWGYEQTNVDFYQVLKVTETRATIRHIKKAVKKDGRKMEGWATPIINEFDGEKMSRKIHLDGYQFLLNENHIIRKWDNKPALETYYG